MLGPTWRPPRWSIADHLRRDSTKGRMPVGARGHGEDNGRTQRSLDRDPMSRLGSLGCASQAPSARGKDRTSAASKTSTASPRRGRREQGAPSAGTGASARASPDCQGLTRPPAVLERLHMRAMRVRVGSASGTVSMGGGNAGSLALRHQWARVPCSSPSPARLERGSILTVCPRPDARVRGEGSTPVLSEHVAELLVGGAPVKCPSLARRPDRARSAGAVPRRLGLPV